MVECGMINREAVGHADDVDGGRFTVNGWMMEMMDGGWEERRKGKANNDADG